MPPPTLNSEEPLKDRPKARPTFVIDANSELGRRLLRDFEELLRANEESSS